MDGRQINRFIPRVIFVLSLVALITVLIGYTQPPQLDEGPLAHIFQIAIVLVVPMILLFAGTADRKRPKETIRRLAMPAAVLAVAFAALYYLEH